MDMVREWVNLLIVATVLMGIIEIIVPEGETRRFVFLITQVAITVIIATPVLKFINSDFSFEDVFSMKYIEEDDFYIDTLRAAVDRQTVMLESVYSESIVNEFNSTYDDMKITGCKISFERDVDGKIINISSVEIFVDGMMDNRELLIERIAKICEVEKSRVKVG